MNENETLGRGKRIIKKKIDVDTPDTLVVKRNYKREKALHHSSETPTSSKDKTAKVVGKQLLRDKVRFEIHATKCASGKRILKVTVKLHDNSKLRGK